MGVESDKKKDPNKFDREAYKHAISMLESSGGKLLETGINPKTGKHYSSAAGKYHFLYESIKNDPEMRGVTKRQFINNPALQERIMDKALDGKLTGYLYGIDYAKKLKSEAGSDMNLTDLVALVHFIGAGNAKKYLKDPDNFVVPGDLNMTAQDYVSKFRKYFDAYNPDPNVTKEKAPSEMGLAGVEVDNTAVSKQEPKIPQGNFNLDFLQSQQTSPNAQVSANNGNPDGFSLDFIDNKFKKGGQMGSQIGGLNELVTLFENGGSHEENPLGGIPQGVGANGKINLVEEGEAKWNNYIFSNSFSLDGTYKGSDGSISNVFADGGDMTTGPDKKEKPEVTIGPFPEKPELKFTKSQNQYNAYGGLEKVSEEFTVPDVREQYMVDNYVSTAKSDKVNFDMAVQDPSAREFLNRYDNEWSRTKMKEQTGLSDADIDNMILKGLSAQKVIGGNEPNSKASVDRINNIINVDPKHARTKGIETHERVHISNFDAAQGKNLMDILGDPSQQKTKKYYKEIRDYMRMPHEAYGNFSEFREKLKLKPGQQIKSEQELKDMVKKNGLDMENFYRTFDSDKIIKALNTIAYQNNKPISIEEYKLA